MRGVKNELSKVIVGQHELVDMMLATLLCSGHILIEGVPGIAKTLTAKMLAQTLSAKFSRIQFTPDLMPSDIVGTNVFNVKNSEFSFNPGPVFSNIILIDEVNRAPAKTQAALFEVMEEFQVTIDGITYPMEQPYFVIATQNPIEQEGTYKLPEAQLDRFMVKIILRYPSLDEELNILKRFKNDFQADVRHDVKSVLSNASLFQYRELVESVFIKDELLLYIAQIVDKTRQSGDLYLGASPRASLALVKLSKAVAAMSGRSFVIPEDIQYVAFPVLNHRIMLSPEREIEGYTPRDVIQDIVGQIEVPR